MSHHNWVIKLACTCASLTPVPRFQGSSSLCPSPFLSSFLLSLFFSSSTPLFCLHSSFLASFLLSLFFLFFFPFFTILSFLLSFFHSSFLLPLFFPFFT